MLLISYVTINDLEYVRSIGHWAPSPLALEEPFRGKGYGHHRYGHSAI